ncbi:MAG: sulfite exporter TauE/SafE family protein [Bifidobacteriaceae bacterium]|nr:sulfite exporter TauE/SafE family protein [Bifidobacteriaceae bacterium]
MSAEPAPDWVDPAAGAAAGSSGGAPPFVWWRFVAAGAIGGLISGLFGVGGGIVMVPLAMWLGRLDQKRASAVSLLAIIPTALVGALTYGLRGHLALSAAVCVAAGAGTGAWAGARLLRLVPLKPLSWAFAGLLAATAAFMVFFVPERSASVSLGAGVILGLLVLGLVMGVLSGLFGIGGGVVAVPALMALFGLGDLVARGTSLAVMIPAAVTGSATNHRGGLLDFRAGLAMGCTAAAASYVGTAFAFVLNPRMGNLLFAALLVVSAVQLGLRAARLPRSTDS